LRIGRCRRQNCGCDQCQLFHLFPQCPTRDLGTVARGRESHKGLSTVDGLRDSHI
jgi:hypothetical protein